MDQHPGGREFLAKAIGTDATTAFFGGTYEHSHAAHNVRPIYLVPLSLCLFSRYRYRYPCSLIPLTLYLLMPHDRLLRSLCGALRPKLLIFVYRFNAASHDNARWCTVWWSRAVRRHGPCTCTKNLHRRSFHNLESFDPS